MRQNVHEFLRVRLDEDREVVWDVVFNPEQKLRDIDADMELVNRYEHTRAGCDTGTLGQQMAAVRHMMALEEALQVRARVYRNHPDYNPDWEA